MPLIVSRTKLYFTAFARLRQCTRGAPRPTVNLELPREDVTTAAGGL